MREPNSEADVTGRWPTHRFRCRIRTLMALVAVVAGALACCEMQRRGRTYRAQAWYHLAASHQLASES
jgi:hypothetical protein